MTFDMDTPAYATMGAFGVTDLRLSAKTTRENIKDTRRLLSTKNMEKENRSAS